MTTIEPADATTEQAFEEIYEAIRNGYDKSSLALRLLLKWGVDLEEEVDTEDGFKYVLLDYMKVVRKQGETPELLALAFSGRPRNPLLSRAAERYLADPQQALEKYEAAEPPRLPDSLEALVTSRSKLFRYGEFLARVRALGARLCRVEVGGLGGTGFLVGASHVLTNCHVAEPAIRGEARPDEIICRFDFWSEGEGEGDGDGGEGVPVRLAANWLGASRPYSQSDVTGTGVPGDDDLDYALLTLESAVGETAARDGTTRGWFELPEKAPIIARGDAAMIPQHPQGHELEVAFGRVLEFPGEARRYRYDVTTDHGSSGSPVFNADLTLFGLHHAADPDTRPTYNQAIPLWRIRKDLAAQGVEWTF